MKRAYVFLLSVLFVSQSAFSATGKITCDAGARTPRADSVRKIAYLVDLDKGTVTLGCSGEIVNGFCGSIRLDQSVSLASHQLDCRNPNSTQTVSYRFHLIQEDDVENLVTLSVQKSCRTGKIDITAAQTATVISYPSGGFMTTAPLAADNVNCSMYVPGGRR